MTSALIKFSAILFLFGICAADNGQQPVSEVCLRCICEATSGCKQGCNGDACGLYHITRPYWIDAGKPTLPGVSVESPEAFSSCIYDQGCAEQTIQNYMTRFGQDCNGDGKIDCYDYMAIHRRGGYGCAGELPDEYVTVFDQCMKAAAA